VFYWQHVVYVLKIVGRRDVVSGIAEADFPRRRESMLSVISQLSMDSRVRGNDVLMSRT
jgi:hypothetical protein